MDETNIQDQFTNLHQEIENAAKGLSMPKGKESLHGFFKECWISFKFVLSEKENLFFSFLQLVAIAIGYYIWVQFLGWIPQEVWDQIGDDKGGILLNLIFLAWSFLCVGLVAYPLGILTACMGASYTLHSEHRESTIPECLRMVADRSWPIWVFSWVDAWITVSRILDRLPKKKNRTPLSVKIFKELVYQAWKTATLGVIPALVYGRTVKEACLDSLTLLKTRLLRLGELRAAYSLICWIVGIGAYASLIVLFPYIMKLQGTYQLSAIFTFYLFASIPMLLALAVIMLIFRPLYIISATRIYINYADETQLERRLPNVPSRGFAAFMGFTGLIILIVLIMLFRDQLGITDILQNNL